MVQPGSGPSQDPPRPGLALGTTTSLARAGDCRLAFLVCFRVTPALLEAQERTVRLDCEAFLANEAFRALLYVPLSLPARASGGAAVGVAGALGRGRGGGWALPKALLVQN